MKYFIALVLVAIILAFLYGGEKDQFYVVWNKSAVEQWGGYSHRVYCVGDKTGRKFVFEVPAADFQLVQVQNHLRPETVARWLDITEDIYPKQERKNFFDRVTGN